MVCAQKEGGGGEGGYSIPSSDCSSLGAAAAAAAASRIRADTRVGGRDDAEKSGGGGLASESHFRVRLRFLSECSLCKNPRRKIGSAMDLAEFQPSSICSKFVLRQEYEGAGTGGLDWMFAGRRLINFGIWMKIWMRI